MFSWDIKSILIAKRYFKIIHELKRHTCTQACVTYNLVTAYIIRSLESTMTKGPRSAVGNVSGYRCVSDCRSRGREFDPGPVPYFRGD